MFPKPSGKSQPDPTPKNWPSQSQDFKTQAVSAKCIKTIKKLLLNEGSPPFRPEVAYEPDTGWIR